MENSPRFEQFRDELLKARPGARPEIEAALVALEATPNPDTDAPDFRLDLVADLLIVDFLIDFRFGMVNRTWHDASIRRLIMDTHRNYLDRIYGRTIGQPGTRPVAWALLFNEIATAQAAIADTSDSVSYWTLECARQAMADDESALLYVSQIATRTWDVIRPPDAHPMFRDWMVERTIHQLTKGAHSHVW